MLPLRQARGMREGRGQEQLLACKGGRSGSHGHPSRTNPLSSGHEIQNEDERWTPGQCLRVNSGKSGFST